MWCHVYTYTHRLCHANCVTNAYRIVNANAHRLCHANCVANAQPITDTNP